MHDLQALREAICMALPVDPSNHGLAPAPERVYLPSAHVKALRLESSLVIGARGVGKSFWTAVLRNPSLRALLGTTISDLTQAEVAIGFAVGEDIDAYPTSAVFAQLMEQRFAPYDIWRAVLLRWLAQIVEVAIPVETWPQTVEWVRTELETVARIMKQADQRLVQTRRQGLIVFDGLDRTSQDWGRMDEAVRELLRLVLELKSYRALHGKVFLREDQWGRAQGIPDASKLKPTSATLKWWPHDLHGLLVHLLINAPAPQGELLRNFLSQGHSRPFTEERQVWLLDQKLMLDSQDQRALFERLAGPWMGKDARRGVPYVWSVSHLADARGETSPRSFLAAIRKAAEDSCERHLEGRPLHFDSIRRGVQAASGIRIAELAEDHPWIRRVCEPLEGISVPCTLDLLTECWSNRFSEGPAALHEFRLPQGVSQGWRGVHEELEQLGVLERMLDGRVNMPDLYRVGFRLGRKGGVKPLPRGT